MSKLIQTYTDLLSEVGLTVRDDGTVLKKDNIYFVKGKPLVLPLESVLRNSTVQDKIVFHPLAESAAKGESDVLEDLRLRFVNKINVNTARLIGFLLLLATGEVKLTLDPEQAKVMNVLKGIDDKTKRDILQVVTATTRGEGKKTPLVKIYLNRKPTVVNGVKLNRNGVVTFPLYTAAKEELADKTKGYSLLGVTLNKKTLEVIIRLFEYIFPGIDTDESAYDAGSNNQIAPYSDALFKTVGGLYAAINDSVKLFKDTDPIIEKIIMEDEWLDSVSNIDSMSVEIFRIPVQPNADGKTRVVDLDAAKAPEPAQPVHHAAPQNGVVVQPQNPMALAGVPAPAQQVQDAAGEPEWITKPDGRRARNPKYLQPLSAGTGFGGIGNSNDPYASPLVMPSSAMRLTQDQMIATPVGGYVAQPSQQNTVYVPYGSQAPGIAINQHHGGFVPGLRY